MSESDATTATATATATTTATTTPAAAKRQQTRTLRERKQRKLYSEEWALGDEEAVEGGRGFSLADKLESSGFDQPGIIKEMAGADLTVAYLQRCGFSTPLLLKDKAGLGIRVPTANFTVDDVRMCVGSRRLLDVMDVNTQKNVEMTMKEWQRYYDDPNKERLLNVISLEFSHTRLENYIQSPAIVRQIDWVDSVWPRHLKEQQVSATRFIRRIESTNLLEDMMYPKVQKYCLMSVKGCFTDFHVDFGGTSVWYHILKGAKVFWLIPPTDRNLQLYEKWVLSGKQSDVFFGDTVDKCVRVHLQAGNTFFIPTGWIHAVYTPSDSLVFGGNFLHPFGIEKQLKIAQVEDTTKVPQKFRYPFFTEMLWYVLERYVSVLLGRSHLLPINDQSGDDENGQKNNEMTPMQNKNVDSNEIHTSSEEVSRVRSNGDTDKTGDIKPPVKHIHLTQQELHGLKAIVMYLHQLPGNRKNVPELIGDPIALIRDVRTLVERHRHDSRDSAITGVPVLQCHEDVLNERVKKYGMGKLSLVRGPRSSYKKQMPGIAERMDKNGAPRRRRTRCKKCEACQRSDCGECVFCHDMVKFGGPGRAKQTCNMRQCLQPMLPVTASCVVCHLDGWMQTPVAPQAKGNVGRGGPSALMECAICYSISHPACVGPGGSAPSDDMPNSWECPQCTNMGLNIDYKPRHFRARQKSSDIRRMSVSSDGSSIHPQRSSTAALDQSLIRDIKREDDDTLIKSENGPPSPIESKSNETPPRNSADDLGTPPEIKRRRSLEGGDRSTCSGIENDPPRKLALRTQLAQQLCSNSTKVLKRPQYPVRPAQLNSASAAGSIGGIALCLERACMIPVFRFLSSSELAICSLVCKTWANYTVDPVLWRNMSFVQCRLTAAHLAGIVRRQPQSLGLEWSTLARRQLAWLIARLPALRVLSLAGSAAAAALALRTCSCPPLQTLDLSFCPGMGDACLRDLLSPPQDSRPGLTGSSTRLRNVRVLRLAGTDITDVSMRYVTQALPSLNELDLSSCARVTDAGVAQLASARCLERLSLAGCRLLTETALEHLGTVQNLVRLDLRHVPLVSTQAVIKFAAKSKHNLCVKDVKLVDRRKTK